MTPGEAFAMPGKRGSVFRPNIAATAFAAPRLGLASMLTIAIATQLVAALAIDHFGLLRLPQSPVSLVKVLGVALVLGCVVLVRRG